MRIIYILSLITQYWLLPKATRAIRLRKLIEKLGPIFVKFGQILSTRVDLLPSDIIKELTLLQDSVTPFPSKAAISIVEQELKKPLFETFAEFEPEPIAAASIAQVHRATLLTGEQVIVKILRPKIKFQVKRDVTLLRNITTVISCLYPPIAKLKLKNLINEFYHTIHDELDLTREAANGSLLRHNAAKLAPFLYIPKIYWQYTGKNILVMEYNNGIAISNTNELIKQNIDLNYLAQIIIKIFFTQAFQDCFFHADLHPGNILVDLSNRQTPKIVLVDFGITGSLNKNDQQYLAKNFMALFNRDYSLLAELHVESNWLPKNTNTCEFAAAMRFICEPMFEQALPEISLGKILGQLFYTASKFHINIQPQLILLQKTLLSIEGLARTLDPNINLWNTARPILTDWMQQHSGIKAIINKIIARYK